MTGQLGAFMLSHHFFWKEGIAWIDPLIRLYQIYRYSTHYCVPFARVEADWHWGGLSLQGIPYCKRDFRPTISES